MASIVRVSVVVSKRPREFQEAHLHLPSGSTLSDAIRVSQLLVDLPDAVVDGMTLGVWGRKASAGQLVCDGDRVEVYRPLQVDPKVARRERFRGQGSKSTGLFANRRPGAKAGY
ncbi:RnfH family protein [Rhodoferax sp.]|jgi:sulfur carrier protein|uniref:RnfH family protein n=1 Tax=Rhodoferax sp. TaxID=50421 RepID=UPI003784AC7D